MMILRSVGLILLFLSTALGQDCSEDTDVCLDFDGQNLYYVSTSDIAGFQFDHNGCVTGASGGDAEANGFTISASSSVILAFSFTGSVIPAGSGTLVVLEGDVSTDCLSEFIFSDSDGGSLNVALSGEDDGDGPPECVMDCPNIDQLDEDDANLFCTILVGWEGDACLDDCDADITEEVAEFISLCTECLADETLDCEEMLDDDDDVIYCDGIDETNGEPWVCCDCDCQDFESDVDCLESDWDNGDCDLDCEDDGGDDGPPECILDCPGIDEAGEPFDPGFCEWFTGISTDACFDDCDEYAMEELTWLLAECEECLEDPDNCGDGDDDGGGDPECIEDCVGLDGIEDCFQSGYYTGDYSCLADVCADMDTWGDAGSECYSDCDADTLCEVPIEVFDAACAACFANGDCGSFSDPGEWVCSASDDLYSWGEECDEPVEDLNDYFGCDDGGDDDGDGPPECVMDCPDFGTAFMGCAMNGDFDCMCEHVVIWSTDACIDDCTEEDGLDEIISSCSECVASTSISCCEVFSDPGDCEELDIYTTIPIEFGISNAYPNPFNPATEIEFGITEYSNVKIDVLDINGRVVDQIDSEFFTPGIYTRSFNGENHSSGLYFIRLRSSGSTSMHKVMLMK